MRRRRKACWAKIKIAELRCRARRFGIPFDLREEDLALPKVCPIFGTPLVVGEGVQTNNSPSVDRIVPALGYVRGNVVVISARANGLKREATIEELQRIINFYRSLGV